MSTGVPLSFVARLSLARAMRARKSEARGERSASSSLRMPRAVAPLRSVAGALDLLQCGIL